MILHFIFKKIYFLKFEGSDPNTEVSNPTINKACPYSGPGTKLVPSISHKKTCLPSKKSVF